MIRIDINECTDGSAKCSSKADCLNNPGSYSCHCKSGYKGDGKTCTDIDECKLGKDNCHEDADCYNVVGSYTCNCKNGYRGSGFKCVG